MLNNEELLQLRSSYIEVGRMVQQYGFGQYNGVLNILAAQIKCIDSNFEMNEKEEYLIERDTVYIHSPVSELFRLFEAVREHRLDLVSESCIKRRIRHLCRRFGLEHHDEIALAVGRVM